MFIDRVVFAFSFLGMFLLFVRPRSAVQKGDAPYFKTLADSYAMSDNFHQSVNGGTGALSNEEKSSLGISKRAGVSILRGGREIDYGWHFMGSKRKENYDDW
jgi:hypothetical protein